MKYWEKSLVIISIFNGKARENAIPVEKKKICFKY